MGIWLPHHRELSFGEKKTKRADWASGRKANDFLSKDRCGNVDRIYSECHALVQHVVPPDVGLTRGGIFGVQTGAPSSIVIS